MEIYYKGEALTKDMTDHELYKTPRMFLIKFLEYFLLQ